jgi:hypothetical protein
MNRFRVFSSLISFGVVIPFLLSVVGYRVGIATNENRVLQTELRLGEAPYENWPDKITLWLNDSIAFRAHAIDYYKILCERCFKASVGERILGRNGEFFSAGKGNSEVDKFLGLLPLSRKKIRSTKYAIASTQALCQLNGICYMCFYIPDKSTLYQADIASYLSPETGLWFAQQKGISNREQLLQGIGGANLNFYDLYPILSERMKEVRVYNRKFDVNHWNARGLMISYEFIHDTMISKRPEALAPSANGAALEFYTELSEKENVEHIKFSNPDVFDVVSRRLPELISGYSKIDPKLNPKIGWKSPVYIENRAKTGGKLFISSDSYLKHSESVDIFDESVGRVFPLIGDFHKYLHMHYSHMNPERIKSIIENYHPDFYIEEFAEHSTRYFRTCNDPYMLSLADFLLQTSSTMILASQETPLASLQCHKASWTGQGDSLVFHSTGSESYINTDTPPILIVA